MDNKELIESINKISQRIHDATITGKVGFYADPIVLYIAKHGWLDYEFKKGNYIVKLNAAKKILNIK